MPEVLARVDLAWDEVVPGDGVTFARYDVGLGDPADGNVIARIAEIATPYLSYHAAPPGPQVYWVSWWGTQAGALIESEREQVPVTLTFRSGWLHDAGDPSHALRVLATQLADEAEQDVEYLLPGGSSLPVAFVGARLARRWQVAAVPERIGETAQSDALRDLVERQRTHGAVLCLRLGAEPGARYFVVAGRPRSEWRGGHKWPSFECIEVSAPESVA